MVTLEDHLAALPTMRPAQLRALWRDVWRRPAPDIGPSLLRHGIAWKLQARVHGELPSHVKRGIEKRLVLVDGAKPCDPVLIRMMALAKAVRECTVSNKSNPLVDRYSTRHRWQLLRISFLAPDIIAAIMAGNHPPALTGRTLIRGVDLPLDWNEQRRLLGFRST